ncbi:MAG: VanZ family protein [Candidatus Cloacimonadales bacterium]|nr:VanZ family protein [Candidatus Cloacimonadales bacterium]
MKKNNNTFYSPRVNLTLYTLLLIATPFLIVRNYLQQVIGMTSQLSLSFLGINIPYILAFVFIVLVSLILVFRPKITKLNLIGSAAVVLMMVIGQNSTDYYFNHKFFELQHNWHYIAYAIFSYIFYRYLKEKAYSSERIVLITFISAICISTFDEAAQILISNRIFDICDISKDIWGSIIGMVVVFIIIEKGKIFKSDWKLRQKKLSSYLQYPASLLFLEMFFAYFILLISSILSENKYIWIALLFSILAFLIFFFIFHYSQKRGFRRVFISLGVLILLIQGGFFLKYRNSNIVYNKPGIVVYKGIPIPYFDIMIFPNGTFRLVDKKIYFNQKDKVNRIYKHVNHILLLGSGADGEGGMGFIDEKMETQFLFNPIQKTALQVIVLKTAEACEEFNILKSKGYDAMFIIHNN